MGGSNIKFLRRNFLYLGVLCAVVVVWLCAMQSLRVHQEIVQKRSNFPVNSLMRLRVKEWLCVINLFFSRKIRRNHECMTSWWLFRNNLINSISSTQRSDGIIIWRIFCYVAKRIIISRSTSFVLRTKSVCYFVRMGRFRAKEIGNSLRVPWGWMNRILQDKYTFGWAPRNKVS